MLLESQKMQYNKELIEEILFKTVLPNLKNGYIEVPVYDNNFNGEKITFNITIDAFDKESPYYLNIYDKDRLINLLYEYTNTIVEFDNNINSENIYDKITYYLTLIWANATYEDLRDPLSFIQRYIDFNNNQTFDSINYSSNIGYFDGADIDIIIKREPLNMETPYSFGAIIRLSDNIYQLPSICYGISDNTCYIYSVQNGKNNLNSEFEKRIKRALYKLNEGVSLSESNDFKEYKQIEGNQKNINDIFYPENISDVSVSAILVLTIFMDLLYDMNINKIKVVPFLPIRYKNKVDSYKKIYDNKLKTLNIKEDEVIRQDLYKKRMAIQRNLTDKFIRNFMRIKYHFNGIDILSYPMEFDEYLTIWINNMDCNNNKLIENIIENKVKNSHTL